MIDRVGWYSLLITPRFLKSATNISHPFLKDPVNTAAVFSMSTQHRSCVKSLTHIDESRKNNKKCVHIISISLGQLFYLRKICLPLLYVKPVGF